MSDRHDLSATVREARDPGAATLGPIPRPIRSADAVRTRPVQYG
ncbi:hypothetical protein [Methylobacterium nodulans]|uniref:Uncharacterized protein n=1 Tax=Methylobacterium nodulans (strain LMG 21967 / CNCM I-2342 / ORS 2060) TaxID=460265 RepID=B8IP43_METNO|nr:hypothetical protein [Methylobacterium nodulans]ACL60361.1 hypothetical protein Mnod_5517 [Methylobacterium nodulans ORS 2060]